MINILMKDRDVLFRFGLQQYLVELFYSHYRMQVAFYYDFTPEAVSQADVIVMELVKGEGYTCISELRFRKKGIFISIVESECGGVGQLTHCMNDTIFMKRSDSLNLLSQKIIRQWELSKLVYMEEPGRNCNTCQCRVLSPQQIRIMSGIYRGCSAPDIAQDIGVSDKTVFTHKYLVMHKFNLSSDYDLLNFLNMLKKRNICPDMFRDFLTLPNH